MLKKRIKYVDFEGEERENDFYFNIARNELSKLMFSTPGGYLEHLKKMVLVKDEATAHAMFEEILQMSYGEKSPDGQSFYKTDAQGNSLGLRFKDHAAYDVLFTELASSPEAMSKFIEGISPKFSDEEMAAAEKSLVEEGIMSSEQAKHLTTNQPNRQSVAPQ